MIDDEIITINDTEWDEIEAGSDPMEIIQDYGNVTLFFVEGRGRGLYANHKMTEGEVILINPVVLVSPDNRTDLHRTELAAYTFCWPFPQPMPDSDEVSEDWMCIALGLNSMLNHSSDANCSWRFNADTLQQSIYTTREVEPYEELTLNYGWPKDKIEHYKLT